MSLLWSLLAPPSDIDRTPNANCETCRDNLPDELVDDAALPLNLNDGCALSAVDDLDLIKRGIRCIPFQQVPHKEVSGLQRWAQVVCLTTCCKGPRLSRSSRNPENANGRR